MINKKCLPNSEDKRICLLLAVFIGANPIILAVNTLVNLIMPNTPLDTAVCYFVICIILLFAVKPIIRRIGLDTLLTVIVTALIFLTSILIRPENMDDIQYILLTFTTKIFPFFILGMSINDYDYLLKYLKPTAACSIISGILYYIIMISKNQFVSSDNMSFAYDLLPCVIFSLWFALEKGALKNYILAFCGIILVFIAGARGPLVCLAFYIFIYLLSNIKSKRSFIMIVISASIIIYLLLGENLIKLALNIKNVMTDMGLPTRILDSVLENEFLNLSGRDVITDVIQKAISKNLFFGYGVCGDREILFRYFGEKDIYPHNIVYEFICQYGLILGSVSLITYAGIILKTLYKSRKEPLGKFIRMILPMATIKLLISSSYLEEPFFFLILGICFNYNWNKKLENNVKKRLNYEHLGCFK